MRKRAGAKASNAAFADDSSVAATLACRYDATASLSIILAQAVLMRRAINAARPRDK